MEQRAAEEVAGGCRFGVLQRDRGVLVDALERDSHAGVLEQPQAQHFVPSGDRLQRRPQPVVVRRGGQAQPRGHLAVAAALPLPELGGREAVALDAGHRLPRFT